MKRPQNRKWTWRAFRTSVQVQNRETPGLIRWVLLSSLNGAVLAPAWLLLNLAGHPTGPATDLIRALATVVPAGLLVSLPFGVFGLLAAQLGLLTGQDEQADIHVLERLRREWWTLTLPLLLTLAVVLTVATAGVGTLATGGTFSLVSPLDLLRGLPLILLLSGSVFSGMLLHTLIRHLNARAAQALENEDTEGPSTPEEAPTTTTDAAS